MTPTEIITLGLDLTHANSQQVDPSTKGLTFLNVVYHDLARAIVQLVGEDFFYDEWTTDAVADQPRGEYELQEPSASVAGIAKLKQLVVKPTSLSDQDYILAEQVDVRALPYDWQWYLDNQPASRPIYYLADNSVFIAPQFASANVGAVPNDQIKLRGIKRLVNLLYAGTEATVLIPVEFHYSLAVGMKRYVYDYLGKSEEARAATAEWEDEKFKILSNLSDRDISVGVAAVPSTAHLE